MDHTAFIYALCIERKLSDHWAEDPFMPLDQVAFAAGLSPLDIQLCEALDDRPLNYWNLRKRNERRLKRRRPSTAVMSMFFEDLLMTKNTM